MFRQTTDQEILHLEMSLSEEIIFQREKASARGWATFYALGLFLFCCALILYLWDTFVFEHNSPSDFIFTGGVFFIALLISIWGLYEFLAHHLLSNHPMLVLQPQGITIGTFPFGLSKEITLPWDAILAVTVVSKRTKKYLCLSLRDNSSLRQRLSWWEKWKIEGGIQVRKGSILIDGNFIACSLEDITKYSNHYLEVHMSRP
jgi:hypothetical protein